MKTIYKIGTLVMLVFLVMAFAVAPAIAARVHLKGGKKAKPKFIDNGLTLTATGMLAGLGNGDVLITLKAMGNPTVICTNPSGKNEPPGHNPAPIQVMGSESIPSSEIKNGHTPFSVTTVAPITPIPGAPDCPNPQWTETITEMAFTSATITVEQAGTVVLTIYCTFSTPTLDGPVPTMDVSCTQS